ncbi:MAG: hypothetical protein ABI548_10370 [Polyangiaceae bacterium]
MGALRKWATRAGFFSLAATSTLLAMTWHGWGVTALVVFPLILVWVACLLDQRAKARDAQGPSLDAGREKPAPPALRLQWWVLFGALAGCSGSFLLGAWLLFSTDFGPPTTNTTSAAISGDAAKVAYLAKYMTLPSPVETAEFVIDYHNNDWAPSDWTVYAAVKIAPSDAVRWAHDHPPRSTADLSFAAPLVGRNARLKVASAPSFYGNSKCWRAIFATEGVIVAHCSSEQPDNP